MGLPDEDEAALDVILHRMKEVVDIGPVRWQGRGKTHHPHVFWYKNKDYMTDADVRSVVYFDSVRSLYGNITRKVGRDDDDRGFYYFSHPIFKRSADDVAAAGFGLLPVQNLSYFGFDADALDTAMIWLGGPENTTTQTHYDQSRNFFFQISGRKRFLLAPPASHESLQVFPLGHAFDRQCHLQGDGFVTSPHALIADLAPGDMLYLPPFYFHRVITTSPFSVSLNIWKVNDELKAVMRNLHDEAGLPLRLRAPSVEDAAAASESLADVSNDELLFLLALYVRTALSENSVSVTTYFTARWEHLDECIPFFLSMLSRPCSMHGDGSRSLSLVIEEVTNRAIRVKHILQTSPLYQSGETAKPAATISLFDHIDGVIIGAVGRKQACLFTKCLTFPSTFRG
jgi:hypothetical protein